MFWGTAGPLLPMGKKGPETLSFPPRSWAWQSQHACSLFPQHRELSTRAEVEKSSQQKGAPVWVQGCSPSQSY